MSIHRRFLVHAIRWTGLLYAAGLFAADPSTDPRVAKLAAEVSQKGWIAYSGKTDKGDWDIFLMRPDGSHRRNLTNTPEFSELAVRFSPDARKILFRRIPLGVKIQHDSLGALGQLVIASWDGSKPEVYGDTGDCSWATWSPDGKELACLTKTGIELRDLATKQVVRKLDRKGIFQQLSWSPDGKWFLGTANAFGETWTIVRMNAQTGDVNAIAKFQNCTPDWFPDSARSINSYRPANQEEFDGGKLSGAVKQKPGYGWTQLWMTDTDGGHRRLVLGEDGKHVYGGNVSPDGKYILFARANTDGGMDTAVMGIMRLADTPAIRGESVALRKLHPEAKDALMIDLPQGWEPHWTYAKLGSK